MWNEVCNQVWPYWAAYEEICWSLLASLVSASERVTGPVDWRGLGLVADKNTPNMPLMRAPWITVTCCILYQVLIPLGQVVMRNRTAWKMTPFMAIYNLMLVLLSLYMCIESITVMYESSYNILCQAVPTTRTELGGRMARVMWWYYVSKLFEFIDTIAMVLRKKNNQITVLHKYHHSTMFILWWIQVHHAPGGQAAFGVALNSFVHVVMYSYYLSALTGVGLSICRRVKPHITELQLLQFFLAVGHAVLGIYFDCGYPKAALVLLLLYVVSLIALFTNFYIQTYLKKNASARRADKDQ